MAQITWDWWFGDGPPRKRLTQTSLKRWIRSKRVRRWLLSLSITGATSFAWAGYLSADTPNALESPSRPDHSRPDHSRPVHSGHVHKPLTVAPVSFGWAAPNSFAMIVADDVQGDDTQAKASQPTLEAEDASNVDVEDEDEQRRQRLRELLREDAPDVPSASKMSDADDSDDDESSNTGKDVFSEPFIEERLPEVAGGRFVLPALRAVSIAQEPIGNGRVPDALNAGEELTLVPLPEDAFARSQLVGTPAWPSLIRPWASANTYSHPLYFEDRMLERHGHERWGCLQPIASGARFFATVPMLPYLSTIQDPCETVYSKGYFRSGSSVPRFYQRPPLERRAIIVQSAATAGGFIALP